MNGIHGVSITCRICGSELVEVPSVATDSTPHMMWVCPKHGHTGSSIKISGNASVVIKDGK